MRNRKCNFIFISVFSCILIMSLIGCHNEQDDQNIGDDVLYAQMYKDSTFLNIEGDLIYPEIIWGNVDVYIPAFKRMMRHLKIKNNLLIWDFKSGAELNVSENIYHYVTAVWKRQNIKLETGEYEIDLYEDGYRIISKISKQKSRSEIKAQRLIYRNHENNMMILRDVILGGENERSLADYIANLEKVCKPNFYYGNSGNDPTKRWSYNCDNACFYTGFSVRCDDNKLGDIDSDDRAGEIWLKRLGKYNLPLISVMNPHILIGL